MESQTRSRNVDILAFNRAAWARQVEQANEWTVPVEGAVIAAARAGDWHVVLTPERPVPRAWFGALAVSMARPS